MPDVHDGGDRAPCELTPETPTAAVPGGSAAVGGVRRGLLVVAAAEALLEAVLERLTGGPATPTGPAGCGGAAGAGRTTAGLDDTGRGLVVQDGESGPPEHHQGAERPDDDRLGDGA